MLLLWPGLCYLYATLCLLLWPGLCGSSMVWTMRLPMLDPMIHLWATIRGNSFPVTNSLSRNTVVLQYISRSSPSWCIARGSIGVIGPAVCHWLEHVAVNVIRRVVANSGV
jgi:hypothetical protein